MAKTRKSKARRIRQKHRATRSRSKTESPCTGRQTAPQAQRSDPPGDHRGDDRVLRADRLCANDDHRDRQTRGLYPRRRAALLPDHRARAESVDQLSDEILAGQLHDRGRQRAARRRLHRLRGRYALAVRQRPDVHRMAGTGVRIADRQIPPPHHHAGSGRSSNACGGRWARRTSPTSPTPAASSSSATGTPCASSSRGISSTILTYDKDDADQGSARLAEGMVPRELAGRDECQPAPSLTQNPLTACTPPARTPRVQSPLRSSDAQPSIRPLMARAASRSVKYNALTSAYGCWSAGTSLVRIDRGDRTRLDADVAVDAFVRIDVAHPVLVDVVDTVDGTDLDAREILDVDACSRNHESHRARPPTFAGNRILPRLYRKNRVKEPAPRNQDRKTLHATQTTRPVRRSVRTVTAHPYRSPSAHNSSSRGAIRLIARIPVKHDCSRFSFAASLAGATLTPHSSRLDAGAGWSSRAACPTTESPPRTAAGAAAGTIRTAGSRIVVRQGDTTMSTDTAFADALNRAIDLDAVLERPETGREAGASR